LDTYHLSSRKLHFLRCFTLGQVFLFYLEAAACIILEGTGWGRWGDGRVWLTSVGRVKTPKLLFYFAKVAL